MQRYRFCRVVICNTMVRHPNGISFEWNLAGESTWPTVKGAEGRRKIVARKFPQYDTGLHNIGSDFVFNIVTAFNPELRSRDWLPKPRQIRKRKLTPRNPAYQRP